MAPPQGKGALLGLLEANQQPQEPATPPKKQRDMSHQSAPPPAKVKQNAKADQGTLDLPSTPIPTGPIQTNGPPVPALQRYGVNMSIDQVNQNVEGITKSFLKKFGYSPTPGHVFDVLKAQGITGPIDYNNLYEVPTSVGQARADYASRLGSGDSLATLPVVEPKIKDLVKSLGAAIHADLPFQNHNLGMLPDANPNYNAWLKENQPYLEEAYQDPVKREALVKGIMHAFVTPANPQLNVAPLTGGGLRNVPGGIDVPAGGFKHPAARLAAESILTEGLNFNPNPKTSLLMKAAVQIAGATIDMPFGFYKIARGVGLDVYDLSTLGLSKALDPMGVELPKTAAPTHTIHTVEQIGQGTVYDFTHLRTNPGYAAMDLWAVLTLGAGVGERVGAAAGIARDGGTAGAITKAIVFKTAPQDFELHFGTYNAMMPLSDTTIVRILQKHTPGIGLIARQKNLSSMFTDGYSDVDLPLVERVMGGSLRKIAKQRQLDGQLDLAVSMTPAVELARINRPLAWGKAILRDIADGEHSGDWRDLAAKQKLGVEKAVQVIMTDDPDPLTVWRGFHQREIDRLAEDQTTHLSSALTKAKTEGTIGADATDEDLLSMDRGVRSRTKAIKEQINNHHAQLEALDLAEKILDNPPKRLQKFVDLAYQASENAERFKKMWGQGLDDDIAWQRIAGLSPRLRGQHVIDLGGGYKGVVDENPAKTLDKLARAKENLANAQRDLNKAKNIDRLSPGSNTSELERLTKLEARHSKRLAYREKSLAKIQESATPLAHFSDGAMFTSDDMEAARLNAGLTDAEWNEMHDELAAVPLGDKVARDAVLQKHGYAGIDGIPFGSDERIAALRGGRGGAYFPEQPTKYRPTRNPVRRIKQSRYGFKPQNLLFHANTGDALRMGDFRFDMSKLLAENLETAYHASTIYTQWHDLWDSAIKSEVEGVPPSSRHRPIRDIQQAPEELKKFVTKLESMNLDQEFADLARGEATQKLHDFLYSTEGVDNKHVRWVDENQIIDKVGGRDTQFWRELDQFVGKGMAPINEPMRLALIFLTPAYALNALGAASTLLISDGFLAFPNLVRAFHASSVYGPDVTRLLDRLSGEGHTSSLVTERGILSKGSQAFQAGWQKITDTMFRRASIIHQLRRQGLLDESLSPEEIYNQLNDPDRVTQTKIRSGSHRSRTAMLDFGRMSWPERAVMRHLIFVYAFVRASGKWSLDFLANHGAQSYTFAQAGKDRQDDIRKFIGEMPDWFMRSGYFATAPNQIYNPIQWNMPGMLAQIAYPLASLFGNIPYESPGDLLGPAATVGIEATTGKDLSGNALPSSGFGTVGDSILQQWEQTPLGQIGVKHAKAAKEKPQTPPAVHSSFLDPISSALSSERSATDQSVMDVDGFWNTWGLALFRSGMPRQVDGAAGAARYWRAIRTTEPQKYHQHELQMVKEMLTRQSAAVGEAPGTDVIQSLDMVAHVSQAIEDYQNAHKGEPAPSPKQINQITLDALVKNGHIAKGDQSKWLKQVKADISPTEINATRLDMLHAAGSQAWQDWVKKVNAITSYSSPKFTAALASIHMAGQGDFSAADKAPQDTKWGYGRRTESVLEKAKELAAQVNSKTGYAQKAAQQRWIEYANSNDHPVTVSGVTFPSPFAYQFASKTPAERQKALAVYARRSPSEMTSLQMQLLTGQKIDPEVTRGWRSIYDALDKAEQGLAFGKHLPQGAKVDVENQVAAQLPAFKAALQFSRLPLAKRMSTYTVVKNSPNQEAWTWLLRQASQTYDAGVKAYSVNGKVRQSLVNELWKREAVPQVKETLEKTWPGFVSSELRLYTGPTTDATADATLTKFLDKLVAP